MQRIKLFVTFVQIKYISLILLSDEQKETSEKIMAKIKTVFAKF
jgi:hypothetical protein